MAKPRKSKTNSRKKRQTRYSLGLLWATIALGIIGIVVVLLHLIPLPPGTGPEIRPPFEELRPPPPSPVPSKPLRPEHKIPTPLVAILIDDMGYNLRIDNAFLDLEAPLSFSFLPEAPHTLTLARKAKDMGRDVLVHLPLEPADGAIDPGPGALCLDMDFDSMLRILKKDLDAVPGAVGVNNHMGSKFTTSKRAMEMVLTEIKRRDLFFVDSRTTKDTVAYASARSLGIPAAERAVFLDHDPQEKAIRKEVNRLVKLSMERGSAIAIGHPTSNTWKVLYEELPRLSKHVKVVPVHEVLVSN